MTTLAQKTKLIDMVKKLTFKGEDADELGFWVKIFDSMDISQQEALLKNLSSELEELENIR
jgi:hypothetical protein